MEAGRAWHKSWDSRTEGGQKRTVRQEATEGARELGRGPRLVLAECYQHPRAPENVGCSSRRERGRGQRAGGGGRVARLEGGGGGDHRKAELPQPRAAGGLPSWPLASPSPNGATPCRRTAGPSPDPWASCLPGRPPPGWVQSTGDPSPPASARRRTRVPLRSPVALTYTAAEQAMPRQCRVSRPDALLCRGCLRHFFPDGLRS